MLCHTEVYVDFRTKQTLNIKAINGVYFMMLNRNACLVIFKFCYEFLYSCDAGQNVAKLPIMYTL